MRLLTVCQVLGLLVGFQLRSDASSADSDSDSSDEEAGGRSVTLRLHAGHAALVNIKPESTLMVGTQSPLMVGDTCEVRSVSLNKWLTAEVTKVDDQTRTVTVEYDTSNGRMKKLLPYQSEDLRKLTGTPVRCTSYVHSTTHPRTVQRTKFVVNACC